MPIWDLALRPLYRRLGELSKDEYDYPAESHATNINDHAELLLPDGRFVPFDGEYPIPNGRSEAVALYGHPGAGKLDKRWERRNMVLARNLGNAPRGKLYVHRKAEARLREALRRSSLACPGYEIQRLGCFNYRHQRHDQRRPLSYHAFGVAVDIDPANNQAKREPNVQAFSEEWFDIWPRGLSQSFVRAWESCGWQWGGRWATFRDPMHFELVF